MLNFFSFLSHVSHPVGIPIGKLNKSVPSSRGEKGDTVMSVRMD